MACRILRCAVSLIKQSSTPGDHHRYDCSRNPDVRYCRLAGALGRAVIPDLTVPDLVIPTLMVKVLPPFAAESSWLHLWLRSC
ncbi:hypothetical protein ACLBOM_05875 [Escherichia coli]